MLSKRLSLLSILAIGATITGCGDKDDSGHDHDHEEADADTDADADADADSYSFESAFETGTSSISYSGQIFRQVLINDLKTHLGDMTDRLNGGWYPTDGEVTGELNFFFDFDSDTSGSIDHMVSTDPAADQVTYDDISSGKNLVGKLAGNDTATDHMDWSTDFMGWDGDGVTSPQSLVEHWFSVVDEQAVDWAGGDYPLDPDGEPVPSVYVTAEGQDLKQLVEKFLRGAIGFSQGADDYLDDDTDGKGLLADHTGPDDGDPYTALEHAWDEGFGYFGASRSYDMMSDDDIADSGVYDADGSGGIDLKTEACFGHSINAAKRDRGSDKSAATDFTSQAWDGFYNGRALLSATAGNELTSAEFTELQGHRDMAVMAWENAIVSTVVHYINDTLGDMDDFGTDKYDFGTHAKHWSEMKGFALSMQFNPRSPLSDSDFGDLHALFGSAPVLENDTPANQAAYREALIEARTMLGDAYGYDTANLEGW